MGTEQEEREGDCGQEQGGHRQGFGELPSSFNGDRSVKVPECVFGTVPSSASAFCWVPTGSDLAHTTRLTH